MTCYVSSGTLNLTKPKPKCEGRGARGEVWGERLPAEVFDARGVRFPRNCNVFTLSRSALQVCFSSAPLSFEVWDCGHCCGL